MKSPSFLRKAFENYQKHIPTVPLEYSQCNYKDIVYLEAEDLFYATYHYNACICENRLFYRISNEPKMHRDRIAMCILDEKNKPIPKTNILIENHSNLIFNGKIRKNGEHTEDPRVVKYKDNWFVTYTDGWKMGVAKLTLDTHETVYSHYLDSPHDIIKLSLKDNREKNWIPFIENEVFYFLYSDNPRQILEYNDTGKCLQYIKTHNYGKSTIWKYGNIRGGCPPLKYKNDNEYIWFFHSLYDNKYYIGAYITSGVFNVIRITNIPLLVGQEEADKQDKMTIKDNVVYPCGAVSVENGWIVSMGVNDYKIGLLFVPDTIQFVEYN